MVNCRQILRKDATAPCEASEKVLGRKFWSRYCARFWLNCETPSVRGLFRLCEHCPLCESSSPIMPCQNNYLGSVPSALSRVYCPPLLCTETSKQAQRNLDVLFSTPDHPWVTDISGCHAVQKLARLKQLIDCFSLAHLAIYCITSISGGFSVWDAYDARMRHLWREQLLRLLLSSYQTYKSPLLPLYGLAGTSFVAFDI